MNCIKCAQSLPDGALFCFVCGKKQTSQSKAKNQKTRGNGQGCVFKRGNSWCIQVTDCIKIVDDKVKQKRRTKSGFKTKKEALLALPDFINGEITQKATTLERLWNDWSCSAMLKLSESKQTHYKTAHKKLESIFHSNIKFLTIRDLQDVIDKNAKTYYPAKDMKNLLSHLYKRAMAEQITNTNLSEFIVLPELKESETEPFTEKELLNLWSGYGSGDSFVGYILLMIYTGMMPGELRRLEKSMINFDDRIIIGCGLKTKKRKETPIVIADIIEPVLKLLYEDADSDKILNMGEYAFYEEFKNALERNSCRVLKPYSCRHTTATALASKNIDGNVLREIMRHTKFTTTQRYIHVDTTPMLDAINSALN